ncbi:hypothetical protein K3495_g11271, partial [Podosphaera aphanis]
MWVYLKTEYKRGSTFALVYQLGEVMDIPPNSSPSSLVQNFESEWLTLCKLAGDSTDDYRSELAKCFSRDKAKRDFLLAVLSRHHKSIVNNLIARDDLSFAQVRQHIIDVDFNTPDVNSAYLTNTQDNKVPVCRDSKPPISKAKECAYYKRHYPSSAKGHSWQYCRKMKADKRKGKKNKGFHNSIEVANMTTFNDKTDSTPFQFTEGLNALYYISFVDDATRYSNVQFLKNKSDAASAIIGLITELETQYGCRTKAFRSDNGGEYVNKDLSKFFAQKGIVHDLTPPYSPESNGIAERLNRSIGEA